MVFKLAPPYLCNLCPNFVSERCSCSLRSASNLCLTFFCTDGTKNLFSFHQFKSGTVFLSSSPGISKRNLLKFLHFFISSLCIIYDWITIMGYSKHEFLTIYMFHAPNKNFSYYTPTSPQQRPLSCVPIVERFNFMCIRRP